MILRFPHPTALPPAAPQIFILPVLRVPVTILWPEGEKATLSPPHPDKTRSKEPSLREHATEVNRAYRPGLTARDGSETYRVKEAAVSLVAHYAPGTPQAQRRGVLGHEQVAAECSVENLPSVSHGFAVAVLESCDSLVCPFVAWRL